jgi:hypothetical protein
MITADKAIIIKNRWLLFIILPCMLAVAGSCRYMRMPDKKAELEF